MGNVIKLVRSSKKIATYAETLGKKLIAATSSGKISRQKVASIARECTPKGIPAPSIFTSSASAEKIYREQFPLFSAEQVKTKVASCAGFYTYSPQKQKPLLFIKEHLFKNKTDLATFGSHEFRHFLDAAQKGIKRVSPEQVRKMQAFRKKIQDTYHDLYLQVYSDLGVGTPNGIINGFTGNKLHEFLGCSKKDLAKYLRYQVKNRLGSKSPRQNIKLLRKLIEMFETERNAFNVQGKVFGMIENIPQNSIAKPTGISLYFDELLQALKSELKLQQKYKVARGLGKNIPARKIKVIKSPIKNQFSNPLVDAFGLSGDTAFRLKNALESKGGKICKFSDCVDKSEQDAIKRTFKELTA